MKCPHCLHAFFAKWIKWTNTQYGSTFPAGTEVFRFKTTMCPTCNKGICVVEKEDDMTRVTEIMAYPKTTSRPVPPEVEQAFADDFREACLVIGDSEKASAALSRRCLQNLLIEKARAKEKADLDSQIQVLIDSGKLPSHLEETIDAIRTVGNFAAHPIKSTQTGEVIDVEPGEAEWLLETLEGLFDFYFVQPAKSAGKIASMNKKLKEAGKPPLKSGGGDLPA